MVRDVVDRARALRRGKSPGVKWMLLVVALGACEKADAPASAPSTSDGWRCFARDPKQPATPQGDVSFTRQRYADGTLAIETVHEQAGIAGATRLVFTQRGDALTTTFRGATVTATLDTPDASRWTMTYTDPKGLKFTEANAIQDGVLTVTSSTPGDTAPTTTRYLAASCSVVVAELAKYPGGS